jgi:hypothetical protein
VAPERHMRRISPSELAQLKALLTELRLHLELYRGDACIPGVDAILHCISTSPVENDNAASIFRTLYQSKGQLADFHVERDASPDWAELNLRVHRILEKLCRLSG